MADVWETANGLNPHDPRDAHETGLGTGEMTNVEAFLFGWL
jgi:hypothetical protein